MPQSLTQTFNETAAAAHKAFPDRLENLVVFICPSSETPAYVSPEIADHLSKNVAAVKEALSEVADYMCAERLGGFAHPSFALAGVDVRMIAFNKESSGMTAMFMMDHELGHHVVEGGTSPFRHLAECAADAYAMLRHIQRFGRDTDMDGILCGHVAKSLILFSDTEHYTAAAVLRVKQLAEEMDISGLSLKETAALAGKIASACQLDDKTLEKICTAFLPAAKACAESKGISEAVFQQCIGVMKECRDDHDIYKAGHRFLTGYPAIKELMKEWAKTDPFWQGALDFTENPKTTAAQNRAPGFKP